MHKTSAVTAPVTSRRVWQGPQRGRLIGGRLKTLLNITGTNYLKMMILPSRPSSITHLLTHSGNASCSYVVQTSESKRNAIRDGTRKEIWYKAQNDVFGKCKNNERQPQKNTKQRAKKNISKTSKGTTGTHGRVLQYGDIKSHNRLRTRIHIKQR